MRCVTKARLAVSRAEERETAKRGSITQQIGFGKKDAPPSRF
jgi:hypothetical protein